MTTPDEDAVRRRKIGFRAWHRGTREMDLIMGRFADAELGTLDAAGLDSFEALIKCKAISCMCGSAEHSYYTKVHIPQKEPKSRKLPSCRVIFAWMTP